MKNKITAILLIVAFLCLNIGASYAKLLENYATIKGTAQVSAPEFYIGSIENETLSINQKPTSCGIFSITGEYRTFRTENLGGVNFDYIPKAKFYVRAKSSSSDQELRLSFGYYKTDNSGPYYLCSETITVTSAMKDYETDFINCSHKPENVKNLFYEFKEIKETCAEGEECPSIEYEVGQCESSFYTKIELSD